MKFAYLQVYWVEDKWIAFDGNSRCDSDIILIDLLNRLGHDRWEYCQYISNDDESYHLLKRSLP